MVKGVDKTGVARTANGTGQMCAAVVSVSSTSTAYNRMKSEKDSGKLGVCNVVASTSDSRCATGDKRLVSGAEVVRTVDSSVTRKRYRVVPIVTTQSNHSRSVYNAVTKTATAPLIVSSVMRRGRMSSSATQPIMATLSNHANNDRNAVTKTAASASTVSSLTCQRDKPSPSTQPILTTLPNHTKNVTRTVPVSPVPSVTCHANTPSSSAQPKLSPSFGKTTFLDAFKDHISQEVRHKIRHPPDAVKQARTRVIHNLNGTRQEPVYNKHGVLVGHYLVQNSAATNHTPKPSSPTDSVTHHTKVTVSGDSQRQSDCDASNDQDDLVIDKMLQLDGSRDVKPRDTASKDVSTSRSMANGYDNEDIPLHDKIARKIKAESLARSIPSDAGPFKCPKCKRLYRTQESCERHALSCDFEVSTSEEEEDDEDDDEDGEVSFKSQFQTVEQMRDFSGATNCVTVDSGQSSGVTSANDYVTYNSNPIVDSEATAARCHIADDTVTDDSMPYRRQSSRTTSSSSETSLIASSVKHGQESSVTDVTAINNGDKERSCDVVEERTLRRGRSRSSIDATVTNCDVNPVVSPLRVHCDVNIVTTSQSIACAL